MKTQGKAQQNGCAAATILLRRSADDGLIEAVEEVPLAKSRNDAFQDLSPLTPLINLLKAIDSRPTARYSLPNRDTCPYTSLKLRGNIVPLSLRIPPEKDALLKKLAQKTGKTKTAVIMAAVDEKLGLHQDRRQLIRDLAGWMSPEDANELRQSLKVFDQINEGDWG